MDRVNECLLDFVGHGSALYSKDNEANPDYWQVDACMKPCWYGFPWSDTPGTHIRLAVGFLALFRLAFYRVRGPNS